MHPLRCSTAVPRAGWGAAASRAGRSRCRRTSNRCSCGYGQQQTGRPVSQLLPRLRSPAALQRTGVAPACRPTQHGPNQPTHCVSITQADQHSMAVFPSSTHASSTSLLASLHRQAADEQIEPWLTGTRAQHANMACLAAALRRGGKTDPRRAARPAEVACGGPARATAAPVVIVRCMLLHQGLRPRPRPAVERHPQGHHRGHTPAARAGTPGGAYLLLGRDKGRWSRFESCAHAGA